MSTADFEPKRRIVTAITNGDPAIVTATSHGYSTGDIVRINVPLNYGMRLPKLEYEIIVVNANSFSINEDTTLLDTFVVPVVSPLTVAEVLPISDMDNVAV